MARPLADFRGESIYLDTNLLVGSVDADSVYHPACEIFFQRALDPAQPIQLVTCTLTLDEVVFVLLQELVAKPLPGSRHPPFCSIKKAERAKADGDLQLIH